MQEGRRSGNEAAKLASSEQASIFARSGELVQTFGHIARVIAEGGRALRMIS